MPLINHPNMLVVKPNTILWRYINLKKFESLIEKQALFFCRADKFPDPFEGSLPKIEQEYRDKNLPANHPLSKFHKNWKKAVCINCWQINNSESFAMWRIYLKSNEGVAIQTNFNKIHEALQNTKENILSSKIRYINYETQGWYDKEEYPHKYYNMSVPLIHKKIEFKEEREFRLLYKNKDILTQQNYWDNQANPKGLFIKINITKLIERIYLPPTIDGKTRNIIKDIIYSNNFDFEIVNSGLSNDPYY